jgi:hypothetical protein
MNVTHLNIVLKKIRWHFLDFKKGYFSRNKYNYVYKSLSIGEIDKNESEIIVSHMKSAVFPGNSESYYSSKDLKSWSNLSTLLSGGNVPEKFQNYINITLDSPNKIVSFSGFGYSGTGAVHDFMRDQKFSIDFLKGREIDILKYTNSIGWLYDKIKNKKIIRKDVASFLFVHILGLSPNRVIYPYSEMSEGLVASKSLFFAFSKVKDDGKRSQLIHNTIVLVVKLLQLSVYSKDQKKEFVTTVQNFFQSILQCEDGSISLIFLNNWIPSGQIRYSELLPKKSRNVVVVRDPLDTLSSWIIESDNSHSSILAIFIFILSLRYRYISYSNYMENTATNTKELLLINFEEFVKNKEMRVHIEKFFSPGVEIQETSRFNAECSEKNIGIFATLKFGYFKKLIVKNLGEVMLRNPYEKLLKYQEKL